MSERYFLLERKGRRWKLVQEYDNVQRACDRCDTLKLLYPSRKYRVAIPDADDASPEAGEPRPAGGTG